MSTRDVITITVPIVAVAALNYHSPDVVPRWLLIDFLSKDPSILFWSFLIVIFAIAVSLKFWKQRMDLRSEKLTGKESVMSKPQKPDSVLRLERQFLAVFWLLRVSFWMAGPYFYAALSSKEVNGESISVATISQISLTGYGAQALLGPIFGRISIFFGKKIGTLVGMLVYGIGNVSMASNSLWVLFLGRACCGVGQTLISNAPESWFIGETKLEDRDPTGQFLRDTFGLAYSLDSVIAILAGQIAGIAASKRGSAGPFLVLPIFLALGALVVLIFWRESRSLASKRVSKKDSTRDKKDSNRESLTRPSPSIQSTVKVILEDPKLIALGAVQSLYESSMYMFVMSWAPTMRSAIKKCFGESVPTPYGTAFSCFMAASLLGGSLFSLVPSAVRLERTAAFTMAVASASLGCSTMLAGRTDEHTALHLFASYLVFESTVGIYFPAFGTLRSKYLPDEHRSSIMTLYAVPLNIMVVVVFLLLNRIGHRGALSTASGALAVASVIMVWLDRRDVSDAKALARLRFRQAVRKTSLRLKLASPDFWSTGSSGLIVTNKDGNFDRRASKDNFLTFNMPQQ